MYYKYTTLFLDNPKCTTRSAKSLRLATLLLIHYWPDYYYILHILSKEHCTLFVNTTVCVYIVRNLCSMVRVHRTLFSIFFKTALFFLFRFSIVFPVQVYTCVAILQACSMHQMFCKVSHSTLANRIIRFSFSTYLYQHLLFCPLSIVLSSISYFRGVSNSDPSGSTFLILKIFFEQVRKKKDVATDGNKS